MVAFQNCGPALQLADPEITREQRLQFSEALKPKTEWSLQSVERQGAKVTLPTSFSLGLSFTEQASNPDLLCAGGCGQNYDLKIVTNCSFSQGQYSVSFNMETGRNDHRMQFDVVEKNQDCATQAWDLWVLEILNRSDLQAMISHDSETELLVIESSGNKLIFSKK